MPIHAPEAKLIEAIQSVLAIHPGGMTRGHLQLLTGSAAMPAFQFRTLLKRLADSGLVRVEGTTKGRHYFPPAPGPGGELRGDWRPSEQGAAVLALVDRPLSQRMPCSYDRAFLDSYVPNRTFYLGESDRSSLAELGGTPDAAQPAGTHARKIMERLLIDLSWNSSRLEGNTYSLLDTEKLFKEGAAPGGKNVRETQMILNHKQAIEFLIEGAGELTLAPRTLRTLHGMLAENLLADPKEEGSLRVAIVGIFQSSYIPLAVPSLIQEVFEQLLLTAQAIRDPFEQAFFLLVHIPYLQPFTDVNKRTSPRTCPWSRPTSSRCRSWTFPERLTPWPPSPSTRRGGSRPSGMSSCGPTGARPNATGPSASPWASRIRSGCATGRACGQRCGASSRRCRSPKPFPAASPPSWNVRRSPRPTRPGSRPCCSRNSGT